MAKKAEPETFVIKGASFVVTQDAERRILRNVDVLVSGGRISKIGKYLTAKRKVDGKKKLLLPGFVNTHTHLPMTVFRGVGDDMVLQEWLKKRVWPLEGRMKRAHFEAGTVLSHIELIHTGTTAAFDFYNDIDLFYDASKRSGLRLYVGQNVYDGKDGPAPKLALAEKFLKKNRPGEIVQAAVCPHSIYSCSDETIVASKDLARKHGSLFQIHLSETRTEVAECEISRRACRPVELADRLGILDKSTSLAHCGWISKSEAKTIASRGASVSHCPVSNMKLAAGGVTPILELFLYGANISLGTDGSVSNNTLDMFGTMKTAALIQKFHRWDASVLPAQQALDFATLGGARLLGLESEIGSIEEGKSADFILLDLTSIRFQPVTNVVSHIIYSATGDVVTDVFVAGRALKRDGRVVAFDTEKEFAKAQKASDELVSGLED